MSSLRLCLIAAVGRNRVIGDNNALPWRLPADLRSFKQATLGKPVLIGRKTWQSIGRPLPGRFPIVLSRDPSFRPDGVVRASTVDEALDQAARIARQQDAAEIMVAGGGALYAALIEQAQRLYLTEVDLAPKGDTLFPEVDPRLWQETSRIGHPATPADDADYAFVIYDKR